MDRPIILATTPTGSRSAITEIETPSCVHPHRVAYTTAVVVAVSPHGASGLAQSEVSLQHDHPVTFDVASNEYTLYVRGWVNLEPWACLDPSASPRRIHALRASLLRSLLASSQTVAIVILV